MSRTVRTVTTAALTLAVSATALVPAHAATKPAPLSTRATASAAVVALALNLPDAIPAIPGVPRPLSLNLVSVDGGGLHDATGRASDLTSALSHLAGGTVVTETPLKSVLQRELKADQAKPGTQKADLLSVPQNPLGLTLAVAPQSVTATVGAALGGASRTQVVTSGLGSLASLGAGPAVDAILDPISQAVATIGGQAKPLTDGLGSVTSQLPSTTVPSPLAPIVGGPATITTPKTTPDVFTQLLAHDVPAQLAAIKDKLKNGAVVTLNGLDAQQATSNLTGGVVRGTASSNLTDVSLFGGLVTVTASKSSAMAVAGGAAGTGKASGSATLAQVRIGTELGDLLNALVSDKGITVGLLDGTLLGKQLDATTHDVVATVDASLNTALAQVVTLLETLNGGAKLIRQGTFTQSVSKDGKSAEAHATPAQVSLGLPGLPNLVQLAIGKSDAVVGAQQVVPATPILLPRTVEQDVHSLPRTGASTTLALLGGMTLLGAVAIRRRRTV